MSFSVETGVQAGNPEIWITNGRPHTPEVWAELAMRKLLYIGDSAPPVLRDQVRAFKDQCQVMITHYIRQAMEAQRSHDACLAEASGAGEVGAVIRRLKV